MRGANAQRAIFDSMHLGRLALEAVDARRWGVAVLGEAVPIPAAVAQRVGMAERAKQLAADASVTPLAQVGEFGNGRESRGDNITSTSGGANRGTTGATYLIRRLKRDAPAVAEALARGEYPSARAAVKAAGLTTKAGRR